MSQPLSMPLFDFTVYKPYRDETLDLIRQFAAHNAFRSAVVEELELDEDFYRRPLRPEDLEFLKFQKPISSETVSRLPSLATNRLLLSIHELGIARSPRNCDTEEFRRFDQFYEDRNQVLGLRIRPFLENYAFDYLSDETGIQDVIADPLDRLLNLVDIERRQWENLFKLLIDNEYMEQGLRLILIQRWSLAPSSRIAVERAIASGYFSNVPAADWPRLSGRFPSDTFLQQLALMSGVTQRQHSYWQFYLPTSLAKANLLYCLGSRPDRAFSLLGAAFTAEAEWLAFGAALQAACPHLTQVADCQVMDERQAISDLANRFTRAVAAIDRAHGEHGRYRLAQGLHAGMKLADRARWDLGEQLRWLSAIQRYCAWARRIEQRIQVECPNIDRDTFIEPREMCSTTHVHNEHRLVVIERGDMIFWGNLGMQLQMTVGDMVLIPVGRLHGSTVVSEECTYHQPIIPENWINELLAETLVEKPSAVQ